MGKYQTTYRRLDEEQNKRKGIHPIWRGVGFVMMLLMPLMGYAGAMVLLDLNQQYKWFVIPSDLYVYTQSDPLLFVKIGLSVVVTLVFYSILLLITFIVNRVFAPSKYGPLDVAPNEVYRRLKRRR